MGKQTFKNMDKECPICEGIIWGKGERVLIEGAKITVCRSCAQHGIKLQKSSQFETSTRNNRKIYQKKSPLIVKRNQNIIDESETIVSDYPSRIRKARAANKLTQDQFAQKLNEKPSLLRRIEAGKAEPTIKLAKKIENVYNIILLEKADDLDINVGKSKYMKKSQGSTLGDIAFIKKKNK